MSFKKKTIKEFNSKEAQLELSKKIELDKRTREDDFQNYIDEGQRKFNCNLAVQRIEEGFANGNKISVRYIIIPVAI